MCNTIISLFFTVFKKLFVCSSINNTMEYEELREGKCVRDPDTRSRLLVVYLSFLVTSHLSDATCLG